MFTSAPHSALIAVVVSVAAGARVVSRVGSAVVSMGRGMWRVVPTLDNTPLPLSGQLLLCMYCILYPSFTFEMLLIV